MSAKPTDELGCQRRATSKLFRGYMTGWHPLFACCSDLSAAWSARFKLMTLGRKSAPVVARQRFSPSPHERSIVQVEDRKTSVRKFAEFAEFLKEFVTELNRLGADGWVVLVEGARDVSAMRDVGYKGRIVSIAAAKGSESRLANSKTVVIMTDLDREGRRLAARYAKALTHHGMAVSLDQRRRLLAASRGVFRHIENLKRFSYLAADVEI